MGLAVLNLHKGIASLCTPARQKSEVCDLARVHSLHLSSVFTRTPAGLLVKGIADVPGKLLGSPTM